MNASERPPDPGLPRIGSLFSGSGMLDEGVRSVFGGTVAWHVENDPAASKVLEYRYPGVPNYGDVTKVKWADVEPVDVITGGSPCQDVSAAGKRLGMRPGTRSGLWASMCDAIDIIRPRLVVWENVRGVLSAEANSNVEPCPFCVGDGRGAHLRALGRVVGDLSELGYDAEWVGLRASDVGAAHGRFRVFILARPAADTSRLGYERVGGARDGRTGPTDRRGEVVPDASGDGRREGRPKSARLVGGSDAAVRSHGPAADTHRCRLGTIELDLLPGESDADRSSAADAHRRGCEVSTERDLRPARGLRAPLGGDPDGLALEHAGLDWGELEPAIRRWERILGRPAPHPVGVGSKGQPKLSPEFDEWLMGWPEGWASDVPGVSWNDVLAMCGNGVVPQQSAAAIRFMLARLAEESRWAA